MRARESWRPSARPLKVGRKPKLTSNKVFEVVQDGSWETAARRGEAGGSSCQLSLFDTQLLNRTERPVSSGRRQERQAKAWISGMPLLLLPEVSSEESCCKSSRSATRAAHHSFILGEGGGKS